MIGSLFLMVASVAGCGAQAVPSGQGAAPAGSANLDSKGVPPMTIQITSTAFKDGEWIPAKYTGDGADVSPPLVWTGLPEGTKELALICDDPDAPSAEPWVHWVIYRIPATLTGLPEGVSKVLEPKEVPGAVQGKNSWPSGQTIGYRGPAPPKGRPHRYFFRLYALPMPLTLQAGATKKQLMQAISGHVLAEGQLMGKYQR
jgi:hypothetical protein